MRGQQYVDQAIFGLLHCSPFRFPVEDGDSKRTPFRYFSPPIFKDIGWDLKDLGAT